MPDGMSLETNDDIFLPQLDLVLVIEVDVWFPAVALDVIAVDVRREADAVGDLLLLVDRARRQEVDAHVLHALGEHDDEIEHDGI